ncbi:uncharacterized protein LOC131250964 isoform X1 [Magnolia sinica]|uniref:uncharacterized protein LOC131250964 isoform X1 n=1 Tax=Magnolia sinica TaxID=86752 RepID=UPI00265A9BC0|nr:uncharacterized protein LOC131250964 isoform X1 [Magnolia sinica]
MLDPITFNILQQLHLDASIIFLLGSCIRGVNWQAALEDAHVLVGDDINWVFRPCHQLHFNVVSSSDGCYYIQVGSIGISASDELWVASYILEGKGSAFCAGGDVLNMAHFVITSRCLFSSLRQIL